ncbi:asparagine synthetase B family protein [Halomarina rubra]|uniref:Asparagine synthase-related protein n=1 Tax=Halomarina rubra TaxID=2071873 RepID=A0ABD6AVU3_9EURY|nr:asparagine synthetase B family protein [Halomarina rubra]
MNPHVHLQRPDDWTRGAGTAVRGTAFVDGERYDADALHDRFSAVDTREAFRAAVEELEGFFAVVRVVEGTVFAATDHVRSIPLFYAPGADLVSDSARALRTRLADPAVDTVAEAEYLSTTYVTGGETLYRDIRQLRAGELLAFETSAGGTRPTAPAVTERHWTYAPSTTGAEPEATPTDRLVALDDALVEAFERCLAVADGRPIAVPLSGGYDSRLVATMLVRLGAEDVRTFTYGRADSSDVRVARDVAAALDLPWRHVEYTADDWYDWFNGPDRESYYERADDFDAIPNLSALPAVEELLADGWLPADSVVVPGQTVAEIGGHLPDRLLDGSATAADLVESVLDRHYCQFECDERLDRTFRLRVWQSVADVCDTSDRTSAYAAWEWQERQAKFLCGDGRIYEHAGLDWWFPLWDPTVAAAWGAIPAAGRAEKRRYTELVETLYADVAEVDASAAARTQATDSRVTVATRRLRSAVADSPLAGVARPLYRRFRGRTASREDGPLAHFGMLSAAQFDRLYAADRSHHAFRALEATGRVSFDPAHEDGWPGDVLTVEGLEATRPDRPDLPNEADDAETTEAAYDPPTVTGQGDGPHPTRLGGWAAEPSDD